MIQEIFNKIFEVIGGIINDLLQAVHSATAIPTGLLLISLSWIAGWLWNRGKTKWTNLWLRHIVMFIFAVIFYLAMKQMGVTS